MVIVTSLDRLYRFWFRVLKYDIIIIPLSFRKPIGLDGIVYETQVITGREVPITKIEKHTGIYFVSSCIFTHASAV